MARGADRVRVATIRRAMRAAVPIARAASRIHTWRKPNDERATRVHAKAALRDYTLAVPMATYTGASRI